MWISAAVSGLKQRWNPMKKKQSEQNSLSWTKACFLGLLSIRLFTTARPGPDDQDVVTKFNKVKYKTGLLRTQLENQFVTW